MTNLIADATQRYEDAQQAFKEATRILNEVLKAAHVVQPGDIVEDEDGVRYKIDHLTVNHYEGGSRPEHLVSVVVLKKTKRGWHSTPMGVFGLSNAIRKGRAKKVEEPAGPSPAPTNCKQSSIDWREHDRRSF